MELTIYEELYQTPLKFDFEPPYCGKVDCGKPQHCNGNHDFNDSTSYFLRNHQNKTVVSRTTKISQQGLEQRAQNQEAKRIRLRNENETNIPSKKSNRYYKRHSKKRPISLARL